MTAYQKLQTKYFPTLEMYTLAITHAHGDLHPETYEIHKLFQQIQEKTSADSKADLSREYQRIRQITNNYAVPADACPTMTITYKMLAELDQVYFAS